MKPKRMACILDEDTVLERYLCPVCGKAHYGEWDAVDYLDYTTNGPLVGKYDGWDDAMEIICDGCIKGAEFFFGDKLVLHLLKHDDSDVLEFLAKTARRIREGVTRSFGEITGSFVKLGHAYYPVKNLVEAQVFEDGSRVRFLGGNWVLVPSDIRKQYGPRPVDMGIV